MEDLVFVGNEAQLRSVISRKRAGSFSKKIIVVALNAAVSGLFQKFASEAEGIELKGYSPEIIPGRHVIDAIKKIGASRIGGVPFGKVFFYEDLSLSFLLEFWFCADSVVYFPPIVNIFSKISWALENIRGIDSVFVFDDGTEDQQVVRLAAEQQRKKIYSLSSGKEAAFCISPNAKMRLKQFRFVARKSFVDVVYWLSKLFDHAHHLKFDRAKKIVGVMPFVIPFFDEKTAAFDKKNVYELIRNKIKIKELPRLLLLDIPSGTSLGLNTVFSFDKNAGVKRVAYEHYLSWQDFFNARTDAKHIASKYIAMKKSRRFRNIFSYQGINFFRLVENNLDFFFTEEVFNMILDIKAYERMLLVERPSAVLSFSATSMFGRELLYCCNKHRIPSIGIEHGSQVYSVHSVHLKSQITDGRSIRLGKLPTPSKLLVNGPIGVSQMKVWGNYPCSMIFDVGNPKYDLIPFYPKVFSVNRMKQKLGLSLKKKIVVVGTQPLPQKDLSERLIRTAFSALSRIKDIQVVVKIHPRERDLSLHRTLIAEYGLKDVKILQNVNILDLMFAADYLITGFSTIIAETAAMGKIPIIIDLFAEDYAESYGKHIPVVKTDSGLRHLILKLIKNKKYENYLKNKMKDLVAAQFGKIDGRSTERIAAHILPFIENVKNNPGSPCRNRKK